MTKCNQHDIEYKVQALKLAHEIGGQRATEELGIPRNTPVRADVQGTAGCNQPWPRQPESGHNALTLSQELTTLRQQVRVVSIVGPYLGLPVRVDVLI